MTPDVLTPGLDVADRQVGDSPTPPVEPGPASLGPARLPEASAFDRDLVGQGIVIQHWIDGLATVFSVDADGFEHRIGCFKNVRGDIRVINVSAGVPGNVRR